MMGERTSEGVWRLGLPFWLLLLGAAVGFGPPSLGDGTVWGDRFGSAELAGLAQAPTVPPSVRSAATILVDATTGHTILGSNADARLAPASLTKMMTALVAVERAQLTDVIAATRRSLAEPTVIGLDPGDRLSLEDMLYGLLLASGNDAALAIAETVGAGSIERFVGWMNERAQQMGLLNTHFVNPTGLDEALHYSSARDLAQIGRVLMQQPTLAQVVGTARYTVSGPQLYLFRNTNPLLGAESGIEGIKTGFTDDAGRCLAVSITRDGHRLVAVVLNSPDPEVETRAIVDAGFSRTRWVRLELPVPGLAAVRVTAGGSGPDSIGLGGWETGLLRGFSGAENRFWVGGRSLVPGWRRDERI